MILIIIFIGMIIAISTYDPLKILIKLMIATVIADPLKSFKQHSKILNACLQFLLLFNYLPKAPVLHSPTKSVS